MASSNIFLSRDEMNKYNDLSGKVTYTNIIETIPRGATETQINDWKNIYSTEWRWRFLTFVNKKVVEISYMSNNSDKRIYFNKHGEFVERNVDKIFDEYVEKQYFYYTK